MNKTLTALALLAAWLAAAPTPAPAADPIRLHVYTAIEGEYDTQPGKSYTLQGSSNLTGADMFTLRLEFKPDKWDEYDLTFTDGAHGSFIRRQYTNSQLKNTDADTFYVTLATP